MQANQADNHSRRARRRTLTMIAGGADRDADDRPTIRIGSTCAGPGSPTGIRSCAAGRTHQTRGGSERASNGCSEMGPAEPARNRRSAHASPARQHRGGLSRSRQAAHTQALRPLRLRRPSPRTQAASRPLRELPGAAERWIRSPLAPVQALSSFPTVGGVRRRP
jgi:hypothetical protein